LVTGSADQIPSVRPSRPHRPAPKRCSARSFARAWSWSRKPWYAASWSNSSRARSTGRIVIGGYWADAYAALTSDQQSQIQEFLLTLGRAENVNAPPVDLSGGWELVQFSAGVPILSFVIPTGTLVPHGGFLIIAHNATKSQFQSFYGKTLGTNVVYINSAATKAASSRFPQINGSDSFALRDPNFVLVDGNTIAEPSAGLKTFARTNCGAAAGAAASWISVTSSAASATPGTGPLSTGQNRICFSEIADATSTGFEYVEIFVE